MRAVSFVSRLEFKFEGKISKNAIFLGDVDNDSDNELAVGNLNGDLGIFKRENQDPYFEAHGLGMVMVVLVGDILNEGKNSVICISGEGKCSLFEIKSDLIKEERKNLRPFHMQKLPANTKVAHLADVDNDGELELILGLTDHVLRTYRWVKLNQTPNDFTGKLVGLHKLELADQICSISLNPSVNGSPFILVVQSGGTYMHFQCLVDNEEVDDNGSVGSKLTTPVHHPLASTRMRNPNISSEILGGISGTRNGKPTNSLIAVATLDGTLMLVDGDDILWSLQVDHQLFAISKLDIIGNGEEEVVACAWGGQTYIVNQKKQSVRFQFDEPVCSFTSGKYSLKAGSPVPALVYATFSEKIYLYYDIQLPSFTISNFLEVMDQQPEKAELISQFPIEGDNKKHLRSLLSYCLYDLPSTLKTKDISLLSLN